MDAPSPLPRSFGAMPPAASGRDRPRDRPEAAGDDGFASLVALPEADGVALPEADGAVDKPAQGGILPAAQSAGARGSGWRSADYPTAEGRRVSPCVPIFQRWNRGLRRHDLWICPTQQPTTRP